MSYHVFFRGTVGRTKARGGGLRREILRPQKARPQDDRRGVLPSRRWDALKRARIGPEGWRPKVATPGMMRPSRLCRDGRQAPLQDDAAVTSAAPTVLTFLAAPPPALTGWANP